MRKYMVFYINQFFIEVSIAIEAADRWAAKWDAVTKHNIDATKITRIV